MLAVTAPAEAVEVWHSTAAEPATCRSISLAPAAVGYHIADGDTTVNREARNGAAEGSGGERARESQLVTLAQVAPDLPECVEKAQNDAALFCQTTCDFGTKGECALCKARLLLFFLCEECGIGCSGL